MAVLLYELTQHNALSWIHFLQKHVLFLTYLSEAVSFVFRNVVVFLVMMDDEGIIS